MQRPSDTLDVAILGGGPVGCALALALAEAGSNCVLLERRPLSASMDASLAGRALALSYATRLILERIGAWPAAAATTIESIHVSQSGMPGRVRLDAQDAGVPALGYVVSYAALLAALHARIAAVGVPLRAGLRARIAYASAREVEIRVEEGHGEASSIAARCAVHAEGSSEDMPEKHYRQEAIAGILEVEPAAGATAFERFTPQGPLALLPMAGTYALIWSARPERAQALLEATDTAFLEALEKVIGRRAGRLRAVKARQHVPVVRRLRPTRVAERAVFIGNAAQTLHPVAGQGLNLGFRDAAELAALIGQAADAGDATLLRRYAAKRQFDAGATILVTDLLASRFATGNPFARGMGALALAALDVLPAPRRFFTRRMVYGLRAFP